MKNTGKFIVSLDFELFWGMRDKISIEKYGDNILGVWEALPKMLETFEKKGIKATFATVGFLFASSKAELVNFCPTNKPKYTDENLSPYNGHFDLVGDSEETDKYHFASKLINLINSYPHQEIATHTFSHYYCLENGQEKQNFEEDTIAAIEIAKKSNVDIKSLVFPRNQFNNEYLKVIKDLGINSYRGNEKIWFHSASKSKEEKLGKRAFRLLDSYFNISGHNCYTFEEIKQKEPFDIPSSRFLRPYSSKLKMFEKLKLRRILNSMTYAAQKGKIYHLWWHPHNFGINQQENFNFLDEILSHYLKLNDNYGFESLTMNDLSTILQQSKING